MELWEKVRRFLLFWLAVLVFLIAASLFFHGADILRAVASSFRAGVSALVTLGIIVAVIVWMLRSIF